MRTRLALVAALVVTGVGPLWSQQPADRLAEATESYAKGDYSHAIVLLRGIALEPTDTPAKADAYFWLAKSYLALDNLEDGGRSLEHFLATYPGNPRTAEALYEKGRLLHRQEDYENAIQVLQGFLERYPESDFVANAYFWIGESLYALGQLDDALLAFRKVVEAYPTSFKVEAARYRAALIEFKKRENELLKLLKWSHEESLRTIEGFQRRETAYEQAIASYQRTLAASQQPDLQETVDALNKTLGQRQTEIRDVTSRLETATAEVERLRALGAVSTQAQPQAAAADTGRREGLLTLKAKALALKEELLNWMLAQAENR
jgi:TolA-binding protein